MPVPAKAANPLVGLSSVFGSQTEKQRQTSASFSNQQKTDDDNWRMGYRRWPHSRHLSTLLYSSREGPPLEAESPVITSDAPTPNISETISLFARARTTTDTQASSIQLPHLPSRAWVPTASAGRRKGPPRLCPYKGTSLTRKRTPLRPYRRPVPRVLGVNKGGS